MEWFCVGATCGVLSVLVVRALETAIVKLRVRQTEIDMLYRHFLDDEECEMKRCAEQEKQIWTV